jgi:predicted small lipoprotein YifL
VILIVKPAFALPIATAVLGALLAGCGQTGPLYMPPPLKPVPAAKAESSPTSPDQNAPVETTGQPAPGSLPTPVTTTPAPTQQQ